MTGLIYAAIVVAWAAYLVPLALRRHDEAARSRSIERFSSAMRVLSRRGESDAERVVVAPPRTQDRVLTPSLAAKPAAGLSSQNPTSRPTRAAQQAAAARRRRVLAVLVALLVVTVGASAYAVVAWWATAVPVALIVGFLIVARTQVRKAEEAFWSTAAEQTSAPSNVVRRAARVDASHGAAKAEAADAPAGDDEPTVTLTAQEIAAAAEAAITESRTEAVALTTSDGGSLWDPLPITLPTYVDKPAARRTIRTIELGEPGTWSAGHSDDDSRAVAVAVSAGVETDAADEAVDDPRQAVNG